MSERKTSSTKWQTREKRLEPLKKGHIRDPRIKPRENTQLPGKSRKDPGDPPPGKVIKEVEKREPGQRDGSDKL
jgi:hypothetical protein